MRKIIGIMAAAAAVAFAAPASAATVTSLDFSTPTPSGPVITATATSSGVAENVTDSVDGLRRSPWQGTVHEGAEYTSVSLGADGSNGWAQYDFGVGQTILTILWGSVDTYNDIDFYYAGGLVDTINGQALINAGAAEGLGAVVATITANLFDSIVIRTTGQNAFEFAELDAAVPLPGAAVLLLSGLGGLAFARRRRNAKTA